MKKRIGVALGIAGILAALGFVVYRWRASGFSWRVFVESLGGVDWNWLAMAVILIGFTYLGRALRWEVMLRPLTGRTDLLGILSATCIGFTAVVLFGRAGEPVRPFLIARKEGVSFSSQIAAWVVERILDILMILMIFGIALTQVSHSALPPGPQMKGILQAGGAAAGVTGFLCLALLAGLRQFRGSVQKRLLDALGFLPLGLQARVSTFLAAFGEGVESTRTSSFTILLLIYSLLEWTVLCAAFYCVLRAFPATDTFGFTDVVILVGFVSFGSVVQIPGLGGGMQIATVLMLTGFYGLSLEAASGIALVLWLVSFVTIVPVGAALAFHEGIKWRTLRQITTSATET